MHYKCRECKVDNNNNMMNQILYEFGGIIIDTGNGWAWWMKCDWNDNDTEIPDPTWIWWAICILTIQSTNLTRNIKSNMNLMRWLCQSSNHQHNDLWYIQIILYPSTLVAMTEWWATVNPENVQLFQRRRNTFIIAFSKYKPFFQKTFL